MSESSASPATRGASDEILAARLQDLLDFAERRELGPFTAPCIQQLVDRFARSALPSVEEVSAKVHDAWMDSKRAQGVTTRKAEDGEELMVPYWQLSERAKQLDRGSVQAVYAAINASAASETPRSAVVESLIGQLRKHVSHNVCEDAWYSCSQADCADDRRAGHPCDCGAQHLNELHAHAADALERTVSAIPQNTCELCGGSGYVTVRESGTHAPSDAPVTRWKCNCDGTIRQPDPEPENHERLACEDEDTYLGRKRGGV